MIEQPENPQGAQGPSLSPELVEAICHFFECHPPRAFSKVLTGMLGELLVYRHGEAWIDKVIYGRQLPEGMAMLHDVLRLAAKGGFRPRGDEEK